MLKGEHLSIFFAAWPTNKRLTAWHRGLHPLRCSFASLRITAPQDFARSNLLTFAE
jgi:hypothetical protein